MHIFNQRGNVFVIILVVLACLGGGIYWQQSRKAFAKSEAERLASAKATGELKSAEEAKALQQRIDASRSKSVLQSSLKAVDDVYARWKDAKQVASLTARISLAAPVGVLQGLKRETDALILPDCLQVGRTKLSEAMRLEIEGFLAFMGDTNFGKYVAQANTIDAEKLLLEYSAHRQACPQ